MIEFLSIYWWRILISIVVAYILGSINFAVIFTKMASKKDVREMGSGNAGFTNVLRSVGVVPAVFTFLFDCLKGVFAVCIATFVFNLQADSEGIKALSETLQAEYLVYGKYIAGAFAVIGHCFPVFFGFRGGKGITTTGGVLGVLDWRVLLIVMTCWLIIFIFVKIISVASLSAAVLIVIWNFVIKYFVEYKPSLDTATPHNLSYVFVTTGILLFIGLLAIYMHRGNIKRIINGEEKKITVKKKSA